MPSRARLEAVVQSSIGDVQAGQSVYVYEVDGTTPLGQVMYASLSGGLTLANPLTTDTAGRVVAYAATAQRVILSVGGVGYPSTFEPDPVDIVLAAGAALTTPTLTGPIVADAATFTEQASAPATPGATQSKLYAGDDNRWRVLSSSGTPRLLLEAAQAQIVNADVSASAALDLAKLAPGSSGLLKSNGSAISAGNTLALTDIPNALITQAKLVQGADGQVLAAPGGVNTFTNSPTITGAVTVGSLVPGAAPGGTPAQHALYRNNVAKAWVRFIGSTGGIVASFNVTSVTRVGAGQYFFTVTRAFSSAHYATVITCESGSALFGKTTSRSTTQINILLVVSSTGVAGGVDADYVDVVCMGDQ